MQFGFRKGTGTADAIKAVLTIADDAAKGVVQDGHLCLLVYLDIKNAFNSAPWYLIDDAVAGFGVSQYLRTIVWSYFSERTILVPPKGENVLKSMTCGVTQGSILGRPYGTFFMTVY